MSASKERYDHKGLPFAERHLEAVDVEGRPATVTIRVEAPHQTPESGEDWVCGHQLLGVGDDATYFATGVDSLQALLLSLEMMRLRLTAVQRARSLSLFWLDQADLGLK